MNVGTALPLIVAFASAAVASIAVYPHVNFPLDFVRHLPLGSAARPFLFICYSLCVSAPFSWSRWF